MKVTNSRIKGMNPMNRKTQTYSTSEHYNTQLLFTITQHEFLDTIYKDQQQAPVSSTKAKVSSLLCDKNYVSHGFPLSAYNYTGLQHPVA